VALTFHYRCGAFNAQVRADVFPPKGEVAPSLWAVGKMQKSATGKCCCSKGAARETGPSDNRRIGKNPFCGGVFFLSGLFMEAVICGVFKIEIERPFLIFCVEQEHPFNDEMFIQYRNMLKVRIL
jgi:hypothetical protein